MAESVMSREYILVLLMLLPTSLVQCVSYHLLPASQSLDGHLPHTSQHSQQVQRIRRSTSVSEELSKAAEVLEDQPKVTSATEKQSKASGILEEVFKVMHFLEKQLQASGVLEERSFPYRFEGQSPEHQSHGRPHQNMHAASDRISLSQVASTVEELNLPSLSDLHSIFSPQDNSAHQSSSDGWLARPLNRVEKNFLFILASIVVKLVMSTALASWFLAAGQALYSLATITGTPDIFGMDSAIKFIYLTVPFAEALLRGDTELTG